MSIQTVLRKIIRADAILPSKEEERIFLNAVNRFFIEEIEMGISEHSLDVFSNLKRSTLIVRAVFQLTVFALYCKHVNDYNIVLDETSPDYGSNDRELFNLFKKFEINEITYESCKKGIQDIISSLTIN